MQSSMHLAGGGFVVTFLCYLYQLSHNKEHLWVGMEEFLDLLSVCLHVCAPMAIGVCFGSCVCVCVCIGKGGRCVIIMVDG
jgi:hypothetical protein